MCGHEWPDLRGFEGQVVKCPQCGNAVRVPGKTKAAEAAPEGVREIPAPFTRFGAGSPQPVGQPRAIEPARPTWLGTGRIEAPEPAMAEPEGPPQKILKDAGGAHTFSLKYREELYPSAREFMQHVIAQAEREGEFPPDHRLAFNWSMLMVRGRGRERVICGPDFGRNPFDDVQEDLSIPFAVHEGQAGVIRRTGVKKPMPVYYTEEVVMGQGCLTGKVIKLERKEFPSRGFSGWHILPGDPADLRRVEEKKKWERTPTYRILGRRDIVLSLLSLPVGYSAVVEESGILSVLNGNRDSVWRPLDE
ncbi:MAG: hypothetical protein KIS92_25550 [Planctomycetota bacterium]|nr:hypothetical protein [Planctomycetota bacterium]